VIPVSEPDLSGREQEYVAACMESGWISSSGEFLDRFERGWADACERRHGVGVSNGTVALELAVSALDLEPGSEIIMPTFTIISCAMAAVYNDCVPVVVDADPVTWCMDVDQVEARITSRTRAIMAVHIYGHPVDMDALLTLARRHDLRVIEDAAEAHGARCRVSGEWRACGGLGDVSAFSFYANKIVTTGEGGMALTDDNEMAERLRSRRNLSFQQRQRFLHDELGHNFRLTNLQAAIGVAQLERLAETVARKRRLAARYSEGLGNLMGVQLPVQLEWAENVYWMYGLVLADGLAIDAGDLGRRLRDAGVETRPFFLGLHEQPALHARGLLAGERHPVSERIARRGLYLPSSTTLSDAEIDQVVGAVHDALREAA
jgi:perosamine synthetase